MPKKSTKTGRVFLIGAGPGDPDLITVKGLSILNACDTVVYDNLIPHELIILLGPQVEKIYVGKIADAHTLPQDQINQLLVKLAQEGKKVARLKGGDPFVFGRGGEEAEVLKDNNIPYEVIPGITAGLAGAGAAGIPASHRDMSASILLITAHRKIEDEAYIDWEWVSHIHEGTIIGYMGVHEFPNVVENLIKHGLPADTEAAMVERACCSTQKVIRAKLNDLPQKAIEAGIQPPAIFIIGEVAGLAEKLSWFDNRVLSGVRIMVTRPADQSKWIYQMLRGLGAEVQAYPTIKTTFVTDTDGWQNFATLSGPNKWLLFTSENGVRYFFGYLKQKQIDLRALASYKIAAMGYGTLRTLHTLGYYPDYAPEDIGTADFARRMSEDLDIEYAQIVRVRGHLPNDPVAGILQHEGAEVYSLCVYKTDSCEWHENEIRRLFHLPPHLIMFTSKRSFNSLVEIVGEDRTRELCALSKIATIGPTTTHELEKFGLEVEIEAARHSIPDLITQITEYYNRR